MSAVTTHVVATSSASKSQEDLAAGMDICSIYGFSLHRTSARIQAQRKAAPVAKANLVCRNLGIIKDGEAVTDQALLEFARRFEGQVQPQVISALAALFKLNTDLGPCSSSTLTKISVWTTLSSDMDYGDAALNHDAESDAALIAAVCILPAASFSMLASLQC
jgi:hypothetical protein